MDMQRNANTCQGEGVISAVQSRIQVLVIPTDEEGVIAEDTYAVVQQQPAGFPAGS